MKTKTESILKRLLRRVMTFSTIQEYRNKWTLKKRRKDTKKSLRYALFGILSLLTLRSLINYVTPALNLAQNPSEIYKFVILLKSMLTLSNIILSAWIFIFFKILDYVSSKKTDIYKKFIFIWSVFGIFYVLMLLNSSKYLMVENLPRILLSLFLGTFLVKIIFNLHQFRMFPIFSNFRISDIPKKTLNDFPFILLTLFIIRLFNDRNSSTDSLIYWTGLADKWKVAWPHYPDAFGPGLGSDMSFNYLNLNSGIILFISLSTSLSLLNSSNILLLMSFATIFVAVKVLRLQYERWIFLLILSISSVQINSFARNGYLILFALLFLFAIIVQKQKKFELELSFIPGIVALIGPIGIVYSIILILILLTLPNSTLFSKLKSISIGCIPLVLGIIFFFFRSSSVFYPFIVWPARFETSFLSNLNASKNLIFQNSVASLGEEVPIKSEFYILYKYLFINTAIPGGILFLLTLTFILRLRNKITNILIISAAAIILVFLVSQLFWQRYLIGVIAICFAILCTKFINHEVKVWAPLKMLIVVVILLKYCLIIGGQTTDSYQASSSTRMMSNPILKYKNITDNTFNMISEFGSLPQAWSDISNLISKGERIYLIDEIGSSVIQDQKQLTNSRFPTNSFNSKDSVKILNFMKENNYSHVFINSRETKVKLLTRYPYPDAFEDSSNSSFEACASWPSDSPLPPHVLWKLRGDGKNCNSKYMYFLRAGEIKNHNSKKLELENQRNKTPSVIQTSFIVPEPGTYRLEFRTNTDNFYKKINALSPVQLFRENFQISVRSYYGLNMTSNMVRDYFLVNECPDIRNCKLELSLNELDQILQINLAGFTDLHSFTIRKVENSI